jgi:hypothetical protein
MKSPSGRSSTAAKRPNIDALKNLIVIDPQAVAMGARQRVEIKALYRRADI